MDELWKSSVLYYCLINSARFVQTFLHSCNEICEDKFEGILDNKTCQQNDDKNLCTIWYIKVKYALISHARSVHVNDFFS